MKNLLKSSAAAAVVLLLAPSAASAAVLQVSGTLASTDPTFIRPNFGAPPTTQAGGLYYYDTYNFQVTTSGQYSGQLFSGGFDNVLGLYRTSFDPTAPLTNVMVYDDDSGGGAIGRDARFQTTLTSGETYVAVVTSYYNVASGNRSTGDYTLTFDGVGAVDTGAVPEPASWALMIGGFGLVGGALRRRPAARVRFT